ncbi:MAG: hypothetical protein FWE38_01080 [Firmicutes bacterium]|nr:hypothetical protein [Bacillota bacterium]
MGKLRHGRWVIGIAALLVGGFLTLWGVMILGQLRDGTAEFIGGGFGNSMFGLLGFLITSTGLMLFFLGVLILLGKPMPWKFARRATREIEGVSPDATMYDAPSMPLFGKWNFSHMMVLNGDVVEETVPRDVVLSSMGDFHDMFLTFTENSIMYETMIQRLGNPMRAEYTYSTNGDSIYLVGTQDANTIKGERIDHDTLVLDVSGEVGTAGAFWVFTRG